MKQPVDPFGRTYSRDIAGFQRDLVIRSWALCEMGHWLANPVHVSRANLTFDYLYETEDWAYLYDFANNKVTLRTKPASASGREQEYLGLFRSVVRLLPPDFTATVCLGIDDALEKTFPVPIFCFQKKLDERSILLPDIDFLLYNFHKRPLYIDRQTFEEKSPTAVFAGSTTGGTITPEVARNCALPRLSSARYFEHSKVVDFRLPSIGQCSSPEAESILSTYSFCRKCILPWQSQFMHRFIISMDGNGATCSRVAVALGSNSVLLKYNSPHVLYYFRGLSPWLHYVPVLYDRDVEALIAQEHLTQSFREIAYQGRVFAETFLTEESILNYTVYLLHVYKYAFLQEK